MHPRSPQNNVGLFLRHLALLCMKNFSVTACTSPKNQNCLGGGGGRMLRPDWKHTKCPRTFGEYCTLKTRIETAAAHSPYPNQNIVAAEIEANIFEGFYCT